MGNRSGAEKWERKWKMAPGLKWPKNGRRDGKNGEKMAKIRILGAIFPFRWPFFGHFRPGTIFHSHFSRIFCAGQVSHSPKGPKIEKNRSGIEIFNLDWKNQSRLKFSIPDLQNPPTKNRGLVGGSLENFNLDWKFQSRRAIFRGRTNRVFGKPCFCPLPKRGHFDENGENDEFAFYPLKTRVWLLRPPKTTKMTKMAGVTQEKAWFRKGRVCSSRRSWIFSIFGPLGSLDGHRRLNFWG